MSSVLVVNSKVYKTFFLLSMAVVTSYMSWHERQYSIIGQSHRSVTLSHNEMLAMFMGVRETDTDLVIKI